MRQKGLFPGIVLAEEELALLIEPLYARLWQMIREPFEDLRSRRTNDPAFRILDEGETAQWLRPQIVECARRIFDGDSDVVPEKRRQQFYLRWLDKFAIIPKKLKRGRGKRSLTFSTYDTIQNVTLWSQRSEDGLPDLPRLLVGYVFIEEMTDIKIWIAYPRGKQAGIYLLIPDQDGGIMGVYQPGPDEGQPDEEDKGFSVRPRKKKLPRIGES
jgi:hypothetical protein